MKKTTLLLFILHILADSFAQAPKVSCGKIQRLLNFHSKYLDGRNIAIWCRPDYWAPQNYAVLYMHSELALFDHYF